MVNQVISKQRVADHGEVLTHEREVNAMLDLVKAETERIESRFLEPACGNGNFLAEILRRKLAVVEARYSKSQLDWERNAVVSISSVYGIDILEDNVVACRARLFEIFDVAYTARFKSQTRDECRNTVKFLLGRNIIWGDALSLKTVGENSQPIIFSEWSPVNGSMMKRRDYMLSFLVEKTHQFSLFNDENEAASVPLPVQEFPLTHFLKVADAE
jgi:SAM-dependent methyltransferase